MFKAIFPYSYRHSMPPSLFSLAFRAIVHIRSGTLSPYLSRVLTFRVTSPQLYHSKSWSLTFIFTGITRLTFMGLHLSSFSSLFAQCLPPIRHRSSRFPSSLLMTMSFEFTIRISVMLLSTLHLLFSCGSHRTVSFQALSFSHSRVVWLLLIFVMVSRVTFGDVLKGFWIEKT